MVTRIVRFSLILFVLALRLLCIGRTTSKTEKAKILALCEQYFGPALDSRLNLYPANSFYVLHVTFDRKHKLKELEVVPNYYFAEVHAEWEETETFEYLSKTQYQNFITRVDLIKPKGKLIRPAPPISFVTNLTAWQTSIYENARFTLGVLSDGQIKSFRLEFGEKRQDLPIAARGQTER